jgi:DNA-binding NarL/FixJ family response regulator
MKLLLVEDHDLFREGLKLILTKLDAQLVLIEATNLTDGIAAASQHPDLRLVLFDLGLPGYSDLDALKAFKKAHDRLPVVVLSGTMDKETVFAALEAGAMGFVPKTASTDILWSALQLVLANGIYIPCSILDSSPVLNLAAPAKATPIRSLSKMGLTKRQIEVFKLILSGKSNKAIARDLGLTESTIKAHVKPILKTLNASSRVQAILEVSRLKISLD